MNKKQRISRFTNKIGITASLLTSIHTQVNAAIPEPSQIVIDENPGINYRFYFCLVNPICKFCNLIHKGI